MQAIVYTIQVAVLALTGVLGFFLLISLLRMRSMRKKRERLIVQIEEGRDV